jgi:hypothetical protein
MYYELMTTENNEPTSMADEVTKRVLEALKPEFDQLRGEIRAAKRDLGQDIDAVNANLTAVKAVVDGHTARFRDIGSRFDDVGDRLRRIEDHLPGYMPAE